MKNTIAVAGNIGVGKSTLVEIISSNSMHALYEPVAENPYLADFYRDMRAWCFQSRIFFLTHRLRIHQEPGAGQRSVVQDRSIYEDAEVFEQNLFVQGSMNLRDHETYRSLYLTLAEYLPPPAALIARATASTGLGFTVSWNVQVHGGIGFTWDHDAQLYYRRGKADELLLGSASEAWMALADRVGI